MARNVNVSILRFLHFLSFDKENSLIFTKFGFCQKLFKVTTIFSLMIIYNILAGEGKILTPDYEDQKFELSTTETYDTSF